MDNEETNEVRSYIIIEFIAPGSAIFKITTENVLPLQMLSLSKYLEFLGTRSLEEQHRLAEEEVRQAKERNKIVIPNAVLREK